MKIERTASRRYEVRRGKIPIAHLEYPGMLSFRAEGKLGTLPLAIEKEDFWGRKFRVQLAGRERARMFPKGWRGHFRIEVNTDSEQEPMGYIVRSVGFFSKAFELRREEGEELVLTLRPKFSWRSFTYDYEHDTPELLEEEQEAELLLYTIHAVRLIQAQQAAAAS